MPPIRHQLWQVEFSTNDEEFSEIVEMSEKNAELVATKLKSLESDGKIMHWAVIFLNDSAKLMGISRLSNEFEKRWGIKIDYFIPGDPYLKRSKWEETRDW